MRAAGRFLCCFRKLATSGSVFHSEEGDGDGRSTDEKRARRDSLVRGKKSPVAVEEEERRKKKCDRREEKRISSAVPPA
jgi:hypothetical protein